MAQGRHYSYITKVGFCPLRKHEERKCVMNELETNSKYIGYFIKLRRELVRQREIYNKMYTTFFYIKI